MTEDRFVRLAIVEAGTDPGLRRCTPDSGISTVRRLRYPRVGCTPRFVRVAPANRFDGGLS